MVVLEGGGALLEPALALDGATAACLERAYAQADVSLKLLPKRYINLHQWLSPVTTSVTAAAAAGKDLKLQIISGLHVWHSGRLYICDNTGRLYASTWRPAAAAELVSRPDLSAFIAAPRNYFYVQISRLLASPSF
ncbi:hypothetical protein RR48_06561 [Papilio machaon]|uniref:Uncharacterized protein n=1 Tax=Papilio machaon TaxID=76193 RepID=A0A194RK88_PAPMA|nr:hypothetical protein RR48_06561 [Papilio machaon]